MLRHFLILRIIVAVGMASAVQAQQAPQPLTLAAALERADRQNLDLAAARGRRAVAQAGVRVAGERPNPTAFSGALRDTPHDSPFFDQPVEIGPRRGRRIEVARQESALTDADIAAVERQVRRSVRDAYFALAHARGATLRRTRALRLAERLREIARLSQEVKVQRSQTSLLRAESIPNLGLEFGTDFNTPGLGGFRVGPPGQLSMELPLLLSALAPERNSRSRSRSPSSAACCFRHSSPFS